MLEPVPPGTVKTEKMIVIVISGITGVVTIISGIHQ
ncbi:hypothetical protein SDC9_170927 [bioreactor metagenome]|uniref:Uncharacterized protein n=1 Tax=bioreactor metagenome TaxID=1076179 RepID=A0A645G9G6_9ZZZZ